jgi:16S rRNA (guanine527-N7)-methyltransferase
MQYLKEGALKLGIDLNLRQLEQFSFYYNELIEWNKKVNLTSITDPQDAQIKHFLDSLSLYPALKQPIDGCSFIDIGSGGGFPGLPLKISLPIIKMVLVEATNKKAAFLRHVIQQLGLENVEVLCQRAETAAHDAQYRQRFDYVLCRAVASLATLAELALPFCTTGGRFIALKKGDIAAEIEKAAKAINTMGGGQPEIMKVELEELPNERYLIIIEKVSPTPDKYPRRPGMPTTRPIV